MSRVHHALAATAAALCLGAAAALPTLSTVLPALSSALTTGASVTAAPAALSARPAAVVARSTASSAAYRYNWGKVVAGDEFSYTGLPKSTKWSLYNSKGQSGHGVRRPSQWHVDGSAAVVTGLSNGRTGGMSMKYGQKYGRWELRMKSNKRDSEFHTAAMLWPDRKTPSTCPEVDYLESTHDTAKVKFFLHYGCAPRQTYAVKKIDTTVWHNYAVDWTPSRMTGYIDGVKWFTDTSTSHLPKGSMHQTIQLDWFPDGTSLHQSQMSIAWIRVYKAG